MGHRRTRTEAGGYDGRLNRQKGKRVTVRVEWNMGPERVVARRPIKSVAGEDHVELRGRIISD